MEKEEKGGARRQVSTSYLRGISKAAIQAPAYDYPSGCCAGTSGREVRLRGTGIYPFTSTHLKSKNLL